MPRFKVNSRPFWDGVTMHKQGTVIEIDRDDYPTLLCLDFVPMDEQAKNDLKLARKNLKGPDGKPIPYNPLYLEVAGNLDPNKPKDLERLTPRGARVVALPDEGKKEPEAVVPQTAGLARQE